MSKFNVIVLVNNNSNSGVYLVSGPNYDDQKLYINSTLNTGYQLETGNQTVLEMKDVPASALSEEMLIGVIFANDKNYDRSNDSYQFAFGSNSQGLLSIQGLDKNKKAHFVISPRTDYNTKNFFNCHKFIFHITKR
ncbi:MAG: hypothetical protein HRK26_04240 [Rickettsiaceae bacterium H1]|nr:hypothetical protein [Rickettsiaceae bacterium H1]